MFLRNEVLPIERIIHRLQSTSDETPPWAGIHFIQPVGSDELAEQLKKAYPTLRNLRERKHMAAIDFLKSELEAMKQKGTEASKAVSNVSNIDIDSPHGDINNLIDAVAESNQLKSVVSSMSPSVSSSLTSPRLVERTRQSVEQRHISEPTPVSLSASTAQTYVFSLVDGQPVQQRTKKKMSSEEKRDYKQTRKLGACAKCRKTKAKCTHHRGSVSPPNDTEFERFNPATKRSGSPVLEGSQAKTTKQLKVEEGTSVRSRSPEALRCDHNKRGTTFPSPTRLFQLVEPLLNNAGQLGDNLVGYVQSTSAQEPHRNPATGIHTNPWSIHFDAYQNMVDPLNPIYQEEGTPLVPGEYHSASSPANGPRGSWDFPHIFDYPWINGPDS